VPAAPRLVLREEAGRQARRELTNADDHERDASSQDHFSLRLRDSPVRSAQQSAPRLAKKEPVMTRHAEGTFDVKTTPLPGDDTTANTLIGRYGLAKQFHGDLEGTSKGLMIAAGEPALGNAGYVAIEQVTGTLGGHTGSFALQHMGLMENSAYKLTVVVVPGSGTAELKGIMGTMTITIAGGKHSYTLEYTLPASQ
jgi:hypothetical protein